MDGLNDLTADDPDVVVDDWTLEEDKDRSVADRVADKCGCPIENECTTTNKTSTVRLRSDDPIMLAYALWRAVEGAVSVSVVLCLWYVSVVLCLWGLWSWSVVFCLSFERLWCVMMVPANNNAPFQILRLAYCFILPFPFHCSSSSSPLALFVATLSHSQARN